MAMHVGNSNGSDEPEVMMEINTTPLIDVMLVLLVMLIITIPIQLHAVNLALPVGTPPSDQVKPDEITIAIDDRSQVYWQGLPVETSELESKMGGLSSLPSQPIVKIRPDKTARYAVFANVLASSKRMRLQRVAVIGAEQFVE